MLDRVEAVGADADPAWFPLDGLVHLDLDTDNILCVRLSGGSRRRVKLAQLDPAVAVRSPHHCDVASDTVEPDGAVHPTSLDRRLALQLQTKFEEERDSSLEVVDHDADVSIRWIVMS